VPRNHADVDRGEKERAILDAAEAMLRAAGVAGLSIAALARQLGVAQNSIYWYFPGRDGLLLGVLQRATKAALTDLAALEPAGAVVQLVAAVDRLADLAPLEAAMRSRAPHAPAIATFQSDFDRSLGSLLRDVLAREVPPAAVDDVADAFRIAATGALAVDLPPADRQRILTLLLRSLLGR
jgi:AcrR family transcriptional regulator